MQDALACIRVKNGQVLCKHFEEMASLSRVGIFDTPMRRKGPISCTILLACSGRWRNNFQCCWQSSNKSCRLGYQWIVLQSAHVHPVQHAKQKFSCMWRDLYASNFKHSSLELNGDRQGLAVLHENDIIHYDLKCDNVMIELNQKHLAPISITVGSLMLCIVFMCFVLLHFWESQPQY